MAIRGINAVTFSTSNMTASKWFYGQGLQLPLTFSSPNFATFGSPGGPAEGDNTFHVNIQYSPSYTPPAAHTWNGWGRAIFYVDDVDAVYSALQGAGIQPEFAPSRMAACGLRFASG